ncbi:MAG: hypothetical protein A3E82_00980 [Gammaproteobacteria bacterium RIFCSPHIGHO2_12_FULL_38_11]|nr:MAG: hypothetical protein A3E82_00980 [Gammaproteobacteria bacterium RIFCSPHIGHO2_12_FULL_38_11]
MKRILSILSLCLSLFVCASFGLPAARTYNVQVIIFSHITPQTLSQEQWPMLSADDINTFAANTAPAQPAAALQHEENVLRNSADYKVLLSGSWQESWYDNGSSITIPISNNGALRGALTINLTNYFDVHTNLFLSQPTADLQKIATNGYFNEIKQPDFYFQLSQDRRMRSNELNYISNPIMGMLIKITRLSPN